MQSLTTHRPLREELPMATSQTTKFCTKCKTEKPVEMFHRSSRNKDGRQSHCKQCKSEFHFSHYYKNVDSSREKARDSASRYRLSAHGKLKRDLYRLSNRDKILESARKYHLKNRLKKLAYSIEYYYSHREKILEYGKRWTKENPEKVRAKVLNRLARRRSSEGRLSSGIAIKLYRLQRGKCACCGKPLGNDYQLDHIMPLALGGSNTDSNVQLLRSLCNLQKSAKHPNDFMRQRGFLL